MVHQCHIALPFLCTLPSHTAISHFPDFPHLRYLIACNKETGRDFSVVLGGMQLGFVSAVCLHTWCHYCQLITLDFQARKSFQVFGDLESCVKFHHVICILIPWSPMTPSVFFTSCCCLFKSVVNCTSHLLDVGGTLPGIESQRLFSVSLL